MSNKKHNYTMDGSDDSSTDEHDSRYITEGSGANSVSDDTSTNNGAPEDTPLAYRETLAVRLSKLFMYFVLLLTAAVGTGSYYWASQEEQDDYEREFSINANELLKGAEENAKRIFGDLIKLGDSITSYSLGTDAEWPFVTMSNFDIRSTEPFETDVGAEVVMFAPMVNNTVKKQFEEYAVNNQGWIKDDLFYKGLKHVRPGKLPKEIHSFYEFGTDDVDHDFYIPLWQVGPVPTDASILLTDLYTHSSFRRMVDDAMVDRKLLLSEVVGEGILSDIQAVANGHHSDIFDQPSSFAVEPVFDDFVHDANIVAFIFSVVPWSSYFHGIMSEGINGIIVEVFDTCGSTFYYRVDGADVTFIGYDDVDISYYEDIGMTTEFAEFARFTSKTGLEHLQFCSYQVTIYPTDEYKSKFTTDQPMIFAIIVVGIFAFTSAVFFLYDCMVTRRQDKVMATATRSNAIVTSLFPANVHERIMQEVEEQARQDVNNKRAFGAGQTKKLEAFLDDGNDPEVDRQRALINETKPIADLFVEVTIMFADISGFTSWCSTREPEQVFTLLENIYFEFDQIAKRRKVFKVETVGDCYVAVCGLPEPNKRHPVVMARFARDCQIRMKLLMEQMEVVLGPDTTSLHMRIGLHSGPVTAGVLRGERARFQLFGDAMNTASRMESTSHKGKIHVSEATYDLLKLRGKEAWLEPRHDKIFAKGKGLMNTYWLSIKGGAGSSTFSLGDSSEYDYLDEDGAESGDNIRLSKKDRRLVDWNTRVLLGILQEIATVRDARGDKPSPDAVLQKLERDVLERGSLVIDEVTEIVALPHYVASSKKNATSAQIVIDDVVADEVKDYVTEVAKMYLDNPFHSFDHASHVTLSVTKLLSRIVAPEQQNATNEAALHDHTYGITSDPLTRFAVVLSALIHDAGHTGVPNATLVKEQTPIAASYNNRSVAEQNSIDICWKLLMRDAYKNLRKSIYATSSDFARFRQLMVNTVLATDIIDKDLKNDRNARWERAFSENAYSAQEGKDSVDRKATIVIEHLIQASDVSHTMQHWHVYRKWNKRLFQEMYKAYVEGRLEQDPSENWYKGEIGFFDFYILPLARKLKDCGVFGVSSAEYLSYAQQNRQEWEDRGQEVVEEMISEIQHG